MSEIIKLQKDEPINLIIALRIKESVKNWEDFEESFNDLNKYLEKHKIPKKQLTKIKERLFQLEINSNHMIYEGSPIFDEEKINQKNQQN